jgi:flagellar biosynthesis/type III secretory pathway M-ring protein FliF/YscJ
MNLRRMFAIALASATLAAGSSPALAAGDAAGRLATQTAYEAQVGASVDGLLGAILGPGRGLVQVSVQLNLDQTTRQTLRYDPRHTAPLARTSGRISLTMTAPGGARTIHRATAGGFRQGVSNTSTTIVSTPGTVLRQSISVEIPATTPPAVTRRIRQGVVAAVGYVPGRDTLNVAAILPPGAGTAVTATAASGPGPLARARRLLVPAVAGVGALVFLWILLKLFRGRSAGFGELVALAAGHADDGRSDPRRPPAARRE